MSRRTKKPKREFSKLILYVVGAVTVGVTAFTLIMIWRTENLEPLAYLIPAVFAELATATGFYYSKAKAENRIKLLFEQLFFSNADAKVGIILESANVLMIFCIEKCNFSPFTSRYLFIIDIIISACVPH